MKMEKRYIDPLGYQHAQWRLAKSICDSGWRPDIMIALWRGGAAVGVSVHEFLSFHGWRFEHVCVKCSSYANIGERMDQIEFDEVAEFVFSKIQAGKKVLVVDDVFDTGKTIEAISRRLSHTQMRSACVYWKKKNNLTAISPDWYAEETDEWLVFPHEMQGLSPGEIVRKDPFLA